MNNFIVSSNKINRYTTWFWMIVAAYILASIPAPRTTSISGYSGLEALHELITARWMKYAFLVAYIASFLWMVWQIAAHLPKKHRWLRWTLWAVIITCLCHWLYIWLVPAPDFNSAHFKTYQTTLSLTITLHVVCLLWAGYLLVRNYGGRLRLLGWAILAWQLVPMVLPALLYFLGARFDFISYLRLIEWLLAIYTFWRMRQAFIPNWEDGKEEMEDKK